MSQSPPSSAVRLFRSCTALYGLTLRRQLLSRQTLVCLGLTLLVSAIVLAWGFQRSPTTKKFADRVLIATYVSFLLPIFAISYGASGVGGEREDRTLIYKLITPIPRSVLYLVKALASLTLVAGWAAAALGLFCWLAGDYSAGVFAVFLPASLMGTAVYAALFLFLGALFRHGTIISLAYWFFLEVLIGAMPGPVKRATVAFFVKCLIADDGTDLNLKPFGRAPAEMIRAVSGETAWLVLASALAALLILGAGVLSAREYSELG